MNILILGPQGSGKGTQAELLSQKFGLGHLEMGRELRKIARLDKIVKQALNSGALVPDKYTYLIAKNFIKTHIKSVPGFIFEGYPRSLPQYEQLRQMLAESGKKIDLVINLKISSEESIRRLSARRLCPTCGEIYNLITAPPPSLDKCKCGGNIIQREDDQPPAIKKRLELYHSQTHPVFEKAQSENIGVEIDGEISIQEVNQEILSKINDKNNA